MNDYVSAGVFSVSGSAMTMLAWFRATDFGVADASLLSKAKGTGESNHFWMLGTVDSGGIKRLRTRIRTGTTTSSLTATSGTLVADTWHFAAAVYDGSTIELFLDGAAVGSVAKTGTLATSGSAGVWIGSNPPTSTSKPFHGNIDEVAIFNKALSPQQIAAIYNASFQGIYKGLVGHWKMDETSGTTAYDSSGKGNNGTLIGAATWTSGKFNGAVQVNGSSRVQVASLLTSPRNVTLAAWANLTAASSSGGELISLGDCFAIRVNQGGNTLNAFGWNGANWTNIAVTANRNFLNQGWHHTASVFDDDNNSFRLYVDGVQVAVSSPTSSLVYTGLGSATTMGQHGNGSTSFNFTGAIDDARV